MTSETGRRHKVNVCVRIDQSDKDLLDILAHATDNSVAWHVRQAVRQYVASEQALEILGYDLKGPDTDDGNVHPIGTGR